MGWKHFGLSLKSTIVVLLAFAIVIIVRLSWTEWSGSFTIPFIRTGRYGELIVLLLLGAAVAIGLGKLLQWVFHAETRPARRRR
ncbi:MAG: hypothetical protein QGI60_04145 [archaeon]|jgi:hypothetical protein|nr:hypothetical protein [archaeon]